MIFWIIVGLAILLSAVLIVMVLLQPSKGGGIGSAFGSLGTQLGSTFGSRRTLDFLAKGTTWTAGALAVLCILANVFFVPRSQGPTPVTSGAPTAPAPTNVPTLPGAPAGSGPATSGGANNQQQGQPAQQGQPDAQPNTQQPTTPAPAGGK
jgi:preprotein translocase subunit SecG